MFLLGQSFPQFSLISSHKLAIGYPIASLWLEMRENCGNKRLLLFWQTFSLARNIQTTFFFFQLLLNRQLFNKSWKKNKVVWIVVVVVVVVYWETSTGRRVPEIFHDSTAKKRKGDIWWSKLWWEVILIRLIRYCIQQQELVCKGWEFSVSKVLV